MKNLLLGIYFLFIITLFPKTNFAQVPALGRATTFALFTSTGSFTNSGTSIITGDIGTNVGALTGFPPGTLTGNVYVADSVTALASTNLGTAYASLSALSCDSTIGATMGSGQILTPKKYCITTLASINGNLTLNALGNPNAVFIIKINGALSTGTAAKVLLINSANINNVFWQINGAFTLGDSAVLRGTLIANGALNLLPNSSILGRGLTTAGAINISKTLNTLPVKLISFSATCKGKEMAFNWQTASESNNEFFYIESSSDKQNWSIISKLDGAGNSNSIKKYTYLNGNQTFNYKYYRLKQTDFNGNYSYSEIIVVNNCQEETASIEFYPNPATGVIKLSTNDGMNETSSVSVYDMMGLKVFYKENIPSSIDLSNEANGIYFLYFTTGKEKVVKKLIINHE
ncbi:MAG: ice-binding family protein [Candidatus Methylacidiphilales bacterium]